MLGLYRFPYSGQASNAGTGHYIKGGNMHAIELPQDYALVLQEVDENGQEDFNTLAESLMVDRRRLTHILQSLQHKRLIRVTRVRHESWVSLSSRGRRLVARIWLESNLHRGY
jgi:DNA-binding MarR family transcriptional regulator